MPFLLLLLAELAFLTVFRLPESLAFSAYARMDTGSNLVLPALLRVGLLPEVDFVYEYGLLPLAALKAIAPSGPAALFALFTAVNAGIVWGVWRFARAVSPGRAGQCLLLATLPWIAQPNYPNLAHALEALFLVHALASHASGRFAQALALTTLALFSKPTMAYFYGFYLLLEIGWRSTRAPGQARRVLHEMAPAGAVFVSCALLSIALFSWPSLSSALFPLRAAKNYAAIDTGFFTGSGHLFWRPPGANLKYYFGTVTGFFLVGSLGLLTAGAASLVGSARRPLAAIALLHFAFLVVFYGNAWSWGYYFYLLPFGLCLLPTLSPKLSRAPAAFAALALLGHFSQARELTRAWRAGRAEPERAEWNEALSHVDGKAVALARSGGAELLAPEKLESPTTYHLIRGYSLPGDLARKAAQVAHARAVLAAKSDFEELRSWPELGPALEGLRPAWEGATYVLLKR